MARNCGCAGASCGCKITATGGINVWGIGTADDPYLLTADIDQLDGNIEFTDSSTVNFTVTGQGTPTDPMNVSAEASAPPFPVYTTAGRPSAVTAGAGAFYYDETTELPMWSDGNVWQPAVGMPSMLPKVGGFLMPNVSGVAPTVNAATAAVAAGTPITLNRQLTIDALMARVTTAEAATTGKILLYSSDADGHPTTLIASPTFDASTIGNKTAVLGAPLALAPGVYWVYLRSNSPAGTARFQACTPILLQQVWLGTETPASTMTIAADTGTFAAPSVALAAWTYVVAAATNSPWFGMRRSA